MEPTRESRAEEIFAEAIEIPEVDRSEFLQRRCGDDPEMLERVESLLRNRDAGRSLLESLSFQQLVHDAFAAIAAEQTDDSSPLGARDPYIGRRVGAWKLIRFIGEGGMARVYLAERCVGDFEQQAAVKLIRPGSDFKDILHRFRSERQLLARLEHPNIARLIDGGSTRAGQPYLVMEYVDGLHIDDYCNENRLDLDQRLRLFCTVCDAVHYAHRNLVVHRDLKPGNILVDRDGQPKLLDFGISKVISPDRLDLADRTATVEGLLTPRYASPEQILRESTTTASDVYSLGVVLYELLTGLSPYEGYEEGTESLERIVCDRDPPLPSAVVSARSVTDRTRTKEIDTSETLSAARRSTPERLARRLAGDLDTIVSKAMHKDPERRYVGAGELAQDIRRHLAALPVLARPDTLQYRLSRFVRRNRALVAGVVVAFSALAIGFCVSLVQSVRAVRARDMAEQETYTSRIAAAEAAIRTNRLGEARRHLVESPERFRGWEWWHLWQRLDRSLRSIQAHQAPITDIAFGAGDRLVATSSEDRTIKLWDAQTGEQLSSLGPLSSVPRFVAVHPELELIAAGCDSGFVVVLDRSGRIVARCEDERLKEETYRLATSEYEEDSEIVTLNHPLLAPTVEFDPTGSRMAAGSYLGNVTVWEVSSFQMIGKWDAAVALGKTAIAFSPDGARLATGSTDIPIRVWDLASLSLLFELGVPDQRGRANLSFSPDGQILACASVDGTIEAWSVGTRQRLLRMGGQAGSVRAIAFGANGESIFTASTDQRILGWFASSGEVSAALLGHTSSIQALASSRDGGKLASGDWEGVLKLWDTRTQDVRTFRVPGLSIRRNWAEDFDLSRDGSRLLWTPPPNCPMRLWRVRPGDLGSGWGHSMIGMHSNKGITFDLEAIRGANPGCSIATFTATVGNDFAQTWPSMANPAWVKEASAPEHTVSWMKVLFEHGDCHVGDVVTKTWDPGSSGGLSAPHSNVVWTSPGAGVIDIRGRVWLVFDRGAAVDWRIGIRGNVVASGSVFSGDPYSRAKPFELATGSGGAGVLTRVPVLRGDTVALTLATNQAFGEEVGVNLTIEFRPSTSDEEHVVYDLQSDWSDAQNPHGTWSYNDGNGPLTRHDPGIPGRGIGDAWVFVDGAVRERHLDLTSGSAHELLVPLAPSDRFLTLVSTDGSGKNSHRGDRMIFGDPRLDLVGEGRVVLDLADVVGGGNGFGTGTIGHGIHPGDGSSTVDFNGRPETTIVGDGTYHDVALPFVDGVFVPHGETQLTSNRTRFTFDTDNRSFDAIENGPNGFGWNSQGFLYIAGVNYFSVEPLRGKVLCVAFCSDGTSAVCGHELGLVSMVDCREGVLTWHDRGHASDVRGIDVDPEGRHFATGGHDSLVKVWEMESKSVVLELRGHAGTVFDVAYSSNGAAIASCSEDSTIRIWEAGTGKQIHVLRGHRDEVRGIAFSPDGRLLASASFDGSVKLWDVVRGSLITTLLQRDSGIYTVAFSPDGTRLAAGGMDGIVHLLDPKTRREVARLFGHEGRIFRLKFSAADGALVSTSLDGTIRIWDIAQTPLP